MRRLGSQGFSLVEVLVATGVAAVLGAGAVTFMRSQSYAMRTEAAQLDVNDEARAVMEFMAREIRMAGYNPRPPCAGPFTALQSAGAQTLRIQYDLDEDGALDTGVAPAEDVIYQYNAGTASIERVVGGVTSVVTTDIANDAFAFTYYDSSGLELVPGVGGVLTPAQANAVWRIFIMLRPMKTADTRYTATQARTRVQTSVLLRNRSNPCI